MQIICLFFYEKILHLSTKIIKYKLKQTHIHYEKTIIWHI